MAATRIGEASHPGPVLFPFAILFFTTMPFFDFLFINIMPRLLRHWKLMADDLCGHNRCKPTHLRINPMAATRIGEASHPEPVPFPFAILFFTTMPFFAFLFILIMPRLLRHWKLMADDLCGHKSKNIKNLRDITTKESSTTYRANTTTDPPTQDTPNPLIQDTPDPSIQNTPTPHPKFSEGTTHHPRYKPLTRTHRPYHKRLGVYIGVSHLPRDQRLYHIIGKNVPPISLPAIIPPAKGIRHIRRNMRIAHKLDCIDMRKSNRTNIPTPQTPPLPLHIPEDPFWDIGAPNLHSQQPEGGHSLTAHLYSHLVKFIQYTVTTMYNPLKLIFLSFGGTTKKLIGIPIPLHHVTPPNTCDSGPNNPPSTETNKSRPPNRLPNCRRLRRLLTMSALAASPNILTHATPPVPFTHTNTNTPIPETQHNPHQQPPGSQDQPPPHISPMPPQNFQQDGPHPQEPPLYNDGLTDMDTLRPPHEYANSSDPDNDDDDSILDDDEQPTEVPPVNINTKNIGPTTTIENQAILARIIGTWVPTGNDFKDPLKNNSMRILAANAGGNLNPWAPSNHSKENRLEDGALLISLKHCDMLLLSEGHINQDTADLIEEHANRRGLYRALISPTSLLTAIAIDEFGDLHHKDSAAGVAALLSPNLASRVRGPAQKLASGRVLHFTIGDGKTPALDICPTHVIVAYGVSGEGGKSGARATMAKLVANEIDTILSNPTYADHCFMVYADANGVQNPADRTSGNWYGCDYAPYAIWRVLEKHDLVDVMMEAYDNNPPMTYFTKHGTPTSRIDLAYVSKNMGKTNAATADAPAGISATHAALGLSFENSTHRTPPQDFSTPQARDQHIDHAVAFMATSGGRRWSPNDKTAKKYTSYFESTDGETKSTVLVRYEEAVAEMQKAIATTKTKHLPESPEHDIEIGTHYTNFYDNAARVLLYAEKCARFNINTSTTPKKTDQVPIHNTHDLNLLNTRIIKCQKSLQRLTLTSFQGPEALNFKSILTSLQVEISKDVTLLSISPPNTLISPSPDTLESWTAWLTSLQSITHGRMADQSHIQTGTSWATTQSGNGERRPSSTKRTLDRLSKYGGRKKGGGQVHCLRVTDTVGDDTIILSENDLTELIKNRQQDLGYTTYNFTRIMKHILFDTTQDGPHERCSLHDHNTVKERMDTTRTLLKTHTKDLIYTDTTNGTETDNIRQTLLTIHHELNILIPNIIQQQLNLDESAKTTPKTLDADTILSLTTLMKDLTNIEKQIEIAPQIAKTMRSRPTTDPVQQAKITAAFKTILAPITDATELREALRRCKPGKCGGSSGITREHLLYLPDSALSHFIDIANTIINGSCTTRFKLGVIIPLLKDDRRYRPVTLLETIWKTAMTRVSDRLLDTLHEFKLLNEAQYAFLRGGSTHAPLDLVTAAMQRTQALKQECHICFLDATSAYDTVPLWVLDVAFRRIGAPEDFIEWIRTTTEGHHRIVSTCAGTNDANDSFPLGGLAQGCPFSPAIWLVVADMALSHAHNTNPHNPQGNPDPKTDGVTLAEAGETKGRSHRIGIQATGYADDLNSIGKTNEETTTYAQAMVDMLGCLNIRVQQKKCIYLRSLQAVENDESSTFDTNTITSLQLRNIDGTPPPPNIPIHQMASTINPNSMLKLPVLLTHRTDPNTPTVQGIITSVTPYNHTPKTFKITLDDKTTKTISISLALKATLRRHRADIQITAMGADGTLATMNCTRVEPFHNPKGKTPEERGATKYLGTYLSFLGWNEQKQTTLRDLHGTCLQLKRMACPIEQIKEAIQMVVVAKLLNARLVMPNDLDITNETRKEILQVIRHSLGLHQQNDDDTPEIAIAFLPPSTGVGLNFLDPDTQCRTQDARRLLDGLNTTDDRLAAATWGALSLLTDLDGKQVPIIDSHLATVVGRIRNLQSAGIVIHRTSDELFTLPPKLPLSQDPAMANQQSDEAECHLIPLQVLFIPGDSTIPTIGDAIPDLPNDINNPETPFLPASYSIFAALGMASRQNKTHIWTLHIKTALAMGTVIEDLRFDPPSPRAHIPTSETPMLIASHAARCSGNVAPEAWLQGTDGNPLTPFHIPTSMWDIQRSPFKGRLGPLQNFNPEKRKEFKTLPSATLDCITPAGLTQMAAHAREIKDALRSIPGSMPFWPDHPQILGVTDGSLKYATTSRDYAGPDQKIAYKQALQGITPNPPSPTKPEIIRLRSDYNSLKATIDKTLFDPTNIPCVWVYYAHGTPRQPNPNDDLPPPPPDWVLCHVQSTKHKPDNLNAHIYIQPLIHETIKCPTSSNQKPAIVPSDCTGLYGQIDITTLHPNNSKTPIATITLRRDYLNNIPMSSAGNGMLLNQLTPPPNPQIPHTILPIISPYPGPVHHIVATAQHIISTKLQVRPSLDQTLLLAPTGMTILQIQEISTNFSNNFRPPTHSDMVTAIGILSMYTHDELDSLGIAASWSPPGTRLCCVCARNGDKAACHETENHLGLHSPSTNNWPISCVPHDNPEQLFTAQCVCGNTFTNNTFLRDAHVDGNRELSTHAPTPDELGDQGGAHLWVDCHAGHVLQAQSYVVPHIGTNPANSSRTEATSITQAKLGLIEMASVDHINTDQATIIYTDSMATTNAYRTQVVKHITVPKQSKSNLNDHMPNLHRLKSHLLHEYNISSDLSHIHNEHGRDMTDKYRDHINSRLIATTDRAAGLVAQVIDNRFQQVRNHGTMAALATNGSIIHGDIKDTILAKQTQSLIKILAHPEVQAGHPVRQLRHELIDPDASHSAYITTQGTARQCASRTRLNRDRFCMQDLMLSATYDHQNRGLKSILKTCGSYSLSCPLCFESTTKIGPPDSRQHGLLDCTHIAATTVRTRIHLLNQERWAREGLPGHGIQYNPLACDGHQLPSQINETNPNPLIGNLLTPVQNPHPSLPNHTNSTDDTTVPWVSGYKPAGTNHATLSHTNGTWAQLHPPRLRTISIYWKRTPTARFPSAALPVDFLWHAYQTATEPTQLNHYAAHVPNDLLTFFAKDLNLTHQKLLNPLFATSGIFTSLTHNLPQTSRSTPPSFMPGSTPPDQNQLWSTQTETLPQLESQQPWQSGGLIALHAGKPLPNDTANPTYIHLIKTIIHKSILTARAGHTIAFLTEVHPRTLTNNNKSIDFSGEHKPSNQTTTPYAPVKIHTLLTIPAGRLTNFRTSDEWSSNKTAIKASPPKTLRTQDSPSSNKYPVVLVVYSPSTTDNPDSSISAHDLRKLALTFTRYSCPKHAFKTEKPILWHPYDKSKSLVLNISNFPAPPNGWNIPASTEHDGCITTMATTKYFTPPNSVYTTKGQVINARITAGLQHDRTQLYDVMKGILTTSFCQALGMPLGSLRALGNSKQTLTDCPCCGEATSKLFTIPINSPSSQLQAIGNTLRGKKFNQSVKNYFQAWPNKKNIIQPSATFLFPHPHTTTPTTAKTTQRTGFTNILKRCQSDPYPRPTPHNHHPPYDADPLPTEPLHVLFKHIRDTELHVCFKCAMPYIILDKQRTCPINKPYESTEIALWEEICQLLATGSTQTLPEITAQDYMRLQKPFHLRGIDRQLLHQEVHVPRHRDGLPHRTGMVVLVAASDPTTPEVYIRMLALPLPKDITPCTICNKQTKRLWIACDDCNRYFHTDCAQACRNHPNDPWYCSQCLDHDRAPTTLKWNPRRTRTGINEYAQRARERRAHHLHAHTEAANTIINMYHPDCPMVLLPSPPLKVMVTRRQHIFDGIWQPLHPHKHNTSVDIWTLKTNPPSRLLTTTRDSSHDLHWARDLIAHDLQYNTHRSTTDNDLWDLAQCWQVATASPDFRDVNPLITHPATPVRQPTTLVTNSKRTTNPPPDLTIAADDLYTTPTNTSIPSPHLFANPDAPYLYRLRNLPMSGNGGLYAHLNSEQIKQAFIDTTFQSKLHKSLRDDIFTSMNTQLNHCHGTPAAITLIQNLVLSLRSQPNARYHPPVTDNLNTATIVRTWFKSISQSDYQLTSVEHTGLAGILALRRHDTVSRVGAWQHLSQNYIITETSWNLDGKAISTTEYPLDELPRDLHFPIPIECSPTHYYQLYQDPHPDPVPITIEPPPNTNPGPLAQPHYDNQLCRAQTCPIMSGRPLHPEILVAPPTPVPTPMDTSTNTTTHFTIQQPEITNAKINPTPPPVVYPGLITYDGDTDIDEDSDDDETVFSRRPYEEEEGEVEETVAVVVPRPPILDLGELLAQERAEKLADDEDEERARFMDLVSPETSNDTAEAIAAQLH